MKQSHSILLGLAFCLFTLPMLAQTKFNPKVGLNVSGIDADLGDIRAEARVGWNAGLDLEFGSDRFIFFSPGIHYFSYSADLKQEADIPDFENLKDETTIRNIKMPLNLGVNLTGRGGLLKIKAKGGVTPTYLLGVNEKTAFSFSEDDLEEWTWGANVGVGVEILFLTIDANYEIGLTDYFANSSGKNNMLTLSAGIKF